MPSGLKGALLGFGNPLLDISAGARCWLAAACSCRCAVEHRAQRAKLCSGRAPHASPLCFAGAVRGSLVRCSCSLAPCVAACAVVPKSMLDKYDLKPGNAILAEEKHLPLYKARFRH